MPRRPTLAAAAAAVAAAALAAPAAAPGAQLVVAREHGLSAAQRGDLRRDAGVRHLRDLHLRDVEVVTVADAAAAAALAALRENRDVRWAERDRPVRALDTTDAYLSWQWGLPDVGAPDAWATATGAGELVAVVDTGVDAAHPDLEGRLDPRGATSDPNGHGTHVAGIVAAAAGNGIGIAGVAPGAQVLALAALGADGSGMVSDVADAEARAADLGARVVNLSLGGDTSSLAELTAIRSHPGTLFVAAAGNDGRDVDAAPLYPCAYDEPNVLCVGAEAQDGGAAPFSNTGAHAVDVFAPGVDVLSTWPDGRYAYADGTSMAAPFAAAAAALLLEHDPALTPAQIRRVLVDGSDASPALAGKAVGGALDIPRALGTAAAAPTDPPAAAPAPVADAAAPTDPAPAPAPAQSPADAPAQQPAGSGRAAAPGLGGVRLRGRLVRSCARGHARCRTRAVRLRWRLARAAPLTVGWQRRACARGRCTWRTVGRWRTTAPAGPASARLGAGAAGRALHGGTYRFALSALGARATTRAFAVRRG